MSHLLRGCNQGIITDHDSPGSNLPAGDQITGDIGIVASELFGHGTIRRAKHEQCSVCGVGQCARQDQLSAAERLAHAAQMLLPVDGPAADEILYHVIEQSKVLHDVHLLTRMMLMKPTLPTLDLPPI